MPTITLRTLKAILKRAGGVLRRGPHAPPNGECAVCVRELAYLARRLPRDRRGRFRWEPAAVRGGWTDAPERGSPTDYACQALNDAPWSSDQARTAACLPLALLREDAAVEGWISTYAEATIREIVPLALRAAARAVPAYAEALEAAAARCEQEGTRAAAEAAETVAWRASVSAVNTPDKAYAASIAAGRAATAVDSPNAAALAAGSAAAAAGEADALSVGDRVLGLGVKLLIACHRGTWRTKEM